MKRLIILFSLACFCQFGYAQSGAWLPANADYSYPRTLFKLSEIDSVRDYLMVPEIYDLYTNLHYRAVNQNIPGTLTNDSDRRIIAHLAKNCAFIYLLNRKPVSGGLDTLSATEKAYFRDKALLSLSRINTDVDPFPTGFDSYLWRSNEIADNLIAWDLLKGAGVPDSSLATGRNLLVEYLGNFHAESTTELFGFGFFSSKINNHALRTAAVFGLGAVVLNDVTSSNSDEQPINWINTGLGHQDDVLWRNSGRQSEPNVLAGYAEGPHYFKFGCKHLLEFNHAMGNFLPDTNVSVSIWGSTWNVQNPWYDSRYPFLYEWMTRIRMADGRMPPLEDSFSDHGFPEMALAEDSRWVSPMYFSHWDEEQTIGLARQLRGSTDDLTADYIASRTPPAPATFGSMQSLPASGDLIFRSSWDSSAIWYHMYAQNGRARTSGVGHNQADEASFMLQAYGEYLAFDPGYLRWDRRGEVGNAEDHNMILVNGQGPSTGSIGSPNGADAFIKRTYEGRYLQFGEVETSYLGATILRNSIFVRNRYILLGDLLTSASNKDFEWRLHGSGLESGDSISGFFEYDGANGRGYWLKNGVTLQAQVIGGNGGAVYDRINHFHEMTYDSLVPHTAFVAKQLQTQRGSFLASLVPYVDDSAMVTSYLTGSSATQLNWGGYKDFGLCGDLPASTSGMPDDFTFDGDYGVYSLDSNDSFCFLVMQGGSMLNYGSAVQIVTSQPSYLAFEKTDGTKYTGYFNGPVGTVINISGLDFSPLSATGVVQALTGLPGAASITMSGEGEFVLYDSLIVSVKPQLPGENRWAVYPVPVTQELFFKSDHPVSGEWTAKIIALSGKVVGQQSGVGIEGSIQVGAFPTGMYWFEVWAEGKVYRQPIVVVGK